MITSEESKKLKELLKLDYTAEVLQTLKIKGITNKQGNAYSRGMISSVLNGHCEHAEIEEALFEVYRHRKQALKKTAAKRKRILSE
ncbi:hypothetical protein [Winogradskyella sp.]|uniref:hypothetical protein n=1 Tax=Winogradskyella sp. TaxID=1883156 RepID=UPI003BAA8B88